jgi:hypothetical protein
MIGRACIKLMINFVLNFQKISVAIKTVVGKIILSHCASESTDTRIDHSNLKRWMYSLWVG